MASPALSSAPALPLANVDPLAWRAAPRPQAASAAEARKVGIDFEAMFLTQMLQPMFATVGDGGSFSGGPGERMFRSFQVEEYARAFARKGGIGIASAVSRELLKGQEKAHG
jgi:Rod binding domain-containing protein